MKFGNHIKSFMMRASASRAREKWLRELDYTAERYKLRNRANPESLETGLALLHGLEPLELMLAERRAITLETTSASLGVLHAALRTVANCATLAVPVPTNILGAKVSAVRRLDDFLVTEDGRSIAQTSLSVDLSGRLGQLLSPLRDLEVNNPTRFEYYERKCETIYQDLFNLLEALYHAKL